MNLSRFQETRKEIQDFFQAQPQIRKWLLIALIFVAALGLTLKFSTLLLLLTFAIWVDNVRFSAKKIDQRFIFLMFHITFFVFLLGRPLLALFKPESWIELQITGYGATEDSVFRTVYCMMVSLVGLRLGAVWLERKKRTDKQENRFQRLAPREEWLRIIRVLALILFVVSAVFEMALEVEKAIFIFRNSYVALYSEFVSRAPYLVYVASTFLPYAMCAYLATLPGKRQSYLVLITYVLTTVPTALGGERSKIVLSLCLSFSYFVFRDCVGSEKKWIGKPEKIMIVCGCTVGVVLLGLMNYVREDSAVQQSIPGLVVDFFYKQGVTFSWVCVGLAQIGTLRGMGVTNYTFGNIIDYFAHGTMAQKLFHAQALPGGNNMEQITNGNAMSHHLSYVALGSEQYLAGHGTGSSYLLEIYADYDLLGVLFFSIALGILLLWVFQKARNHKLACMFLFCGLGELLMMPRSSALGFLEFLWRIPFWCTMVYLALGTVAVLRWQKSIHGRGQRH